MPLCGLSSGAGRALPSAVILESPGQESQDLVGWGTVLGS